VRGKDFFFHFQVAWVIFALFTILSDLSTHPTWALWSLLHEVLIAWADLSLKLPSTNRAWTFMRMYTSRHSFIH